MNWEQLSRLALITAGAAVLGRGIGRVVTGRATFRAVADALLTGLGVIIIGAAPGGSGAGKLAVRVAGLLLALAGALLLGRRRSGRSDR